MLQVQTHLASSNLKPSLQIIAHLASCSFSGYTTANSSSTLVFIKSSWAKIPITHKVASDLSITLILIIVS